MNWAAKIKAHGTKQARSKQSAGPRPAVQEAYFTVRNANDAGDPGEVAPCYFTVEGDRLTLTDDRGKPIGKSVDLNGMNPRSIAAVLAGARHREEKGSEFNRRLIYPEGTWR